MGKCQCKKYVIKTKFCPDCGQEQALIEKRYPVEGSMMLPTVAIKSKEYRCPKKGEFFLSGAIPIAYKAFNDLTEKYWIAKIVE